MTKQKDGSFFSKGEHSLAFEAEQTVVIAGCGLLGGSLGLALKARGSKARIIGAGRNESRLKLALDAGAVDEITTDLVAACSNADLIILCTPVSIIRHHLAIAFENAPARAIITDVGSTKGEICTQARNVLKEAKSANPKKTEWPVFVGSHPMAGSDRAGIEFAEADLYEGATCIVMIERENQDSKSQFTPKARMGRFWQDLGCRIVFTTPERHDSLVGSVSHLPHFVAVALVESTRRSGESFDLLRAVMGNGFRDTTRIAAGDPTMWIDIALSNKAELNKRIDEIIAALDELKGLIDSGQSDKLREYIERVQTWRRRLDS